MWLLFRSRSLTSFHRFSSLLRPGNFKMSSSAMKKSPAGDNSVRNNEGDKVRNDVSDESKCADSSVRERVLKQVGFTSTAFIGPAGPPPPGKTDIEDKLSEFYKELEHIDSVHAADGNREEKDAALPQTSVSPKTSDMQQNASSGQNRNFGISSDGSTEQGNRHQKPPSWPHWYQNEPYRKPRTSCMDVTSGMDIPANPRFHRHLFHRYPPPSAIFNPQDQLPNKIHPWSRSAATNPYQEAYFPPAPQFPWPNGCRPPSQGFYGDSPHQPNRNEGACGSDIQLNHSHVSWSANAKQESSHFGEDCDWRQRFDQKYEPCQQQDRNQPPDNVHGYHSSLVLILMRGLPGSGKSTRAKELLSTGPSGLILSADNYFAQEDGYGYDPCLIGAAHEWNQTKAVEAMNEGRSPVIIDNTNIQAWEMKPYVKMALERGYGVIFCEPDTSWKFDPLELEKRNKHGVPQEKIAQMMSRFSSPISIDIVLSSRAPPHVTLRRRPE